jgi:hypothetical protein
MKKLRPEISPLLANVLCQPVVVVGGRLVYRIFCGDARAAVAYAVVLLLDEDLGLGKRLAECDRCKKFFLVIVRAKGGRTRRKYCSDECMTKADQAGAAERVAASRDGVTVKQWRARQRRRVSK